MRKRWISSILTICMLWSLAGCAPKETEVYETEIQVFAAASLRGVMEALIADYEELHPEVLITCNADGSGTLLTQIREGYECDIFFPAAQTQMDMLEESGLVTTGTRKDVVSNQLVVITGKSSNTKVTGLASLSECENIALAGGSVPVGRYTREAMMQLGMLPEIKEASDIAAKEISEALGGVEISEQDNVSKVLIAVAEGACEVGTTYYSDLYGYEDRVTVLEHVSRDLTGDVIYPICQVENPEADENQVKAAADFLTYITSENAKKVFQKYYFDVVTEEE